MLIKVNSLIYKTKINVKIKVKIKITYVLIMRISLYHGKSNRKTNKKQPLVMDCHQNSVPPWNKIQVNQLTNSLTSGGIKANWSSQICPTIERNFANNPQVTDSSSFCFTSISTSSLCSVNKFYKDGMGMIQVSIS